MDFRHNPKKTGKAIAQFNKGDSISDEDLKNQLMEMNPYARARYQDTAARQDYVRSLARFEVLAAEALSQGLANDKEVVLATKKIMVQQLLRRELDEKPSPVSDEEVQAYYEKRKNDYVKPEMIRITHLFLAAPEGSKQRAEKLAQAKSLLEKARALPMLDYMGFATLVRTHTEDEKTKPIDGDLRFLSFDELEKGYGKAFADAALPLRQVGQLAQEVVATPKGFHILKMQGRQSALNLSIEQVKPQILSTLVQQKRMAAYRSFLEKLEARYDMKVDEEAVKAVTVDFSAPTKPSVGSAPGMAPAPTADLP